MRGDSRRDFYAKALALFGLGLLGAIAAVVDNWPVRSSVATASARIDGSGAPAAPLRLDLHKFNLTSDPSARPVAIVRASVRSEPVQSTADLSGAVVEMAAVLQPPPAIPESMSVQRGMPGDLQFATASLADAPEPMPVVFMGPFEDHDYLAPAIQSAAAGASVNDGFFSGAVKKTQDTLAKTGSTIADAFRAVGGAVGGAVKRVMPF